jgi:sugar lactone lactonase YvrE
VVLTSRVVLILGLLAFRVEPAGAAERAGGVQLVYPAGLAVDREGALFISDVGAHRVFKLGGGGRLEVVAGTGQAGFGGDGGPAREARLNAPHDLAFDAEGNLLVVDTYNHRIRRIDARGVMTTVVGSGKSEYSTASAAALEVALNNPQSIAVGREGDLFIADTYNHVIRRLERATGVVSTFAGTEAGLAGDGGPAVKAQINLPQAVEIAPDGTVYISDSANSRIRRVSADGTIRTVTGFGPGSGEGGAGFAGDGGPAEKARLFSPTDLKFNAGGQLYVCDAGNNRVRMIAHGVIITVAGSGKATFGGDGGKATAAGLNTPVKLAIAPDGSVYIADRVNRRVRRVDAQGVVTTVAGAAASAGVMVDPLVLPATMPAGKQ